MSLYIDLWAAGFSSDEDESMSREKGSHAQDTHDLDLLTSLVEKTENTVTMVTDSKVDTRTETDKTETFEESLTKPDNMSLMKGECVCELIRTPLRKIRMS